MKHLREPVKEFLLREEGLETVEYALIVALLVIGVVGALVTMGDAISDTFDRVTAIL